MEIFKTLKEARDAIPYDFSFIFFKKEFIIDRSTSKYDPAIHGPVIVYDILPEEWKYKAAKMFVDFFKLRQIDEIIDIVKDCSPTYNIRGDANKTFVKAYVKSFDSANCKIEHSITKNQEQLQILFVL